MSTTPASHITPSNKKTKNKSKSESKSVNCLHLNDLKLQKPISLIMCLIDESSVLQHNETEFEYYIVFRNWSFSCFKKAANQYSDSCPCFCILPVRFNTTLHLRVNHYFITRTQMKCHMWAPAASTTAGEINLYWTIAGVRVWTWRVKVHLVSFIVCGGAQRPEFSLVWLYCLLYN